MNKVTINLEGLKHNIKVIKGWMENHGATWTIVTKVLCGHTESLKALQLLGVRSMGDSRLANLKAIDKIIPDFESWYLRVADMSSVKEVVTLADVSLTSEIEVINALNEEAQLLDKTHRIVIMIELGDLREGILPGSLINFYKSAFKLSNIEVIGIGANLGCLSGAVPNIDQFTQLALYRELLELKFQRKLPIISAGSSAVLPLLLDGTLPKAINHFRIGEAIFLGTDLINDGTLPDLKNDAIILEAEIAEIKEKGLVPLTETISMMPFETEQSNSDYSPGQRGYRAIVSVGQLDTEVSGLTPVNPNYQIAGASSDVTVINIGDDSDNLKVGDIISFKLNYSALLRLMSGKYIEKEVTPSLEQFKNLKSSELLEVEPAIESVIED
ncbi:MAG: alanine/ornithine racemase family PLP-dependent enzyme [Candidatus Zixiibacteriota bacterium]|nr:MAG: alanine/ornithine racemase family PLP-dependent enzyme [candidate division Zixibacteria bacterium]